MREGAGQTRPWVRFSRTRAAGPQRVALCPAVFRPSGSVPPPTSVVSVSARVSSASHGWGSHKRRSSWTLLSDAVRTSERTRSSRSRAPAGVGSQDTCAWFPRERTLPGMAFSKGGEA